MNVTVRRLAGRLQHNIRTTPNVCNKVLNLSLAQKREYSNVFLSYHQGNSKKNLSYEKPCFNQQQRLSSTSHVTISKCENSQSEAKITVGWSDGVTCDFPHIFLRDNCQCPSCFHTDVQTRLLDTISLIDLDITAKHVHLAADKVQITWPDDHLSVFDSNWLRNNIFVESNSGFEPEYMFGITQKYWDNEIMKREIPFIDYNDWIQKDESVLEHIECLIKYGLVIIRNGPPDPNTGRQMAERIGFGYNKLTHYGDTFTVKVKPIPNNLAYTSNHLPLHMDLPFLKDQPDIQYLHCIKQSEGDNVGASVFSDGFAVAEKLRQEDQAAFDLLSKTVLRFHDVGVDEFGSFHAVYERPTFELNKNGKLQTINFNNFVRSSHIMAKSNKIKDVYKALFKFGKELKSEKQAFKIKLQPGDTVTFDNKRVLHGRTSYDATKTSRWLEGGYIDWDSVRSKYRVLSSKT